MADGNGPAAHVHLGQVPAQLLVDCNGLGGKGLVGLHHVQIGGTPAGLLQALDGGGDGTGAHDRRVHAGGGEGNDAGQGVEAQLAGHGFTHDHHGRGTVIDTGGIAGGHRAIPAESRPQLAQAFRRGAVTGKFIHVEDLDLALFLRNLHRHDLILEISRLLGGLGPLLGLGGKGVLLIPANPELAGDVLGGGAHVIIIEGTPQAILDHGIHHLPVAHLGSLTGARQDMGRGTHVFLASGDHHVGIAAQDRLPGQMNRLETTAADLIDGHGRGRIRDTGLHGGLTGGILAHAGLQHLPEDDLVHLLGGQAGASQQRLHDHGPQGRGRNL
uniref:Uncharacterized protein n=1 Tax=Ectothiorhodospira shaposhnikovii TaxID=1054 RepID=Q9F5Q0_ECTSH|nr:unknown [Ectothiorhodospira shaposhnikovii]